MERLNIFCNGCGTSWTVLHRDEYGNWKPRTCPCCGKEINEQIWYQVIRALHEYGDAQREIIKEAQQPKGTLFEFRFEYDINRAEFGSPDVNRLREEVSNMREEFGDMRSVYIQTHRGKVSK